MSRTGTKNPSSGFTLVEIMVTSAVLALGTVAVFQSNLMNLNVYGRYVNLLSIQNWADEKMWEAKEAIYQNDFPDEMKTSGEFEGTVKTYRWELETEPNPSNEIGSNSLYEITLNVSWLEGNQTARLTRKSFVLKIKKS